MHYIFYIIRFFEVVNFIKDRYFKKCPKKVIVKIHEFLHQQGISLRELFRLTDIRHAALSELENQKRQKLTLITSKKLLMS